MRVFVILSALAIFAFANPAPLGFEIDKATYDDVTKNYHPKTFKKNRSGGTLISVDSISFELDGLAGEYVYFSFDAEDKLVYVSLFFEKSQYNELLTSLSKKYRLKKRTTNKYGEKFAEFEDGNCIINLEATNQTHLYYTSKDELKRYKSKEEEFREKERERKKRSRDNLKTLL